MKNPPGRLIWIDLEMTGLDPTRDRIIEMATIVTDDQLTVIAEGPVLAIHQSDELLAGMDAWNRKHHGQSGLTERVRASTLSEAEAEAQTLAFLKQHVKAGQSPMCGNSVWQDRRFLIGSMPKLDAFFHYRLIDVSTIKELAKRWRPELYSAFKKHSKHEALADIRESIEELGYYRNCFLKTKTIEGSTP